VTILDGTTGGQTDWAADADQKSDVDNDVLFCGYRRDAETGLYHVRFRAHHSTLGRWTRRDPELGDVMPVTTSRTGASLHSSPPGPVGQHVEGFNLYAYAQNSPLSFVDPKGTRCGTVSWMVDSYVVYLYIKNDFPFDKGVECAWDAFETAWWVKGIQSLLVGGWTFRRENDQNTVRKCGCTLASGRKGDLWSKKVIVSGDYRLGISLGNWGGLGWTVIHDRWWSRCKVCCPHRN